MKKVRQTIRDAKALRKILPIATACLMAACGNQASVGGAGGAGALTSMEAAAPVQLNANGARLTNAQSVIMPIDPNVAAKAIANYRINKGGKKGPHEYRGADLNGDGRPELLVYLSGDQWCVKTGCTLAVLRSDSRGFKEITTIRRVKKPVRVRQTSQNGWRTLVVNTGGAGMPLQTVALAFTARGYPGNATRLAPIPPGGDAGVETLFEYAPDPALVASPTIQ